MTGDNATNDVSVLLGDGWDLSTGRQLRISANAVLLRLGDFNGDGKLDILVASGPRAGINGDGKLDLVSGASGASS